MADTAMPLARLEPPEDGDVLGVLHNVSAENQLQDLASILETLRQYAGQDLMAVEAELAGVPRAEDVVGKALDHLLTLSGKRLRPLCVALAARVASDGSEASGTVPMPPRNARAVVELATAVELVHSATLLHDDVVDVGDLRRGKPTARVLYGNAASVFAGDWLLIEALRRVDRAGVPGVLTALLSTIDQMIRAEALQLECRGRLVLDPDVYFSIVDGKTASLFHWAMGAGARAGGLDEAASDALRAYGQQLGLAFQIIDDALDFSGAVEETGKALFTDLREGKLTYPLLVGAERDARLEPLIVEAMQAEVVPSDITGQVLDILRQTEAIEATVARAEHHAGQAKESLADVPAGPARSALALVAEAAVHRDR